ncbi:MAG: hypothetical protein J2P48_18945 [Alphaproteobacteria bacterium]|nr:hypothetical protein [Alphaproteobacteria bacterium]
MSVAIFSYCVCGPLCDLGDGAELFPTQIRGNRLLSLRLCRRGARAGDYGRDRDLLFYRRRASASCERVLLLVPVYYFMAREMTRKELTDFVGQKR